MEQSTSPFAGLSRAPTGKDELVQLTDVTWNYLRRSRASLEFRVREALHFLGGDQWIRYLPGYTRFDRTNLPDWTPQPVSNHLVEHFDYLVEVFSGGAPKPAVSSATRNQRDVDGAKASERVLLSEFERLRTEDRLILPAVGWLILTGNCVLSSTWNPRKGHLLRVPKTKITKTARQMDAAECPNCVYTVPMSLAAERCPLCQGPMVVTKVNELDAMGRPAYDEDVTDDLDEEGNPRYDEVSVGNIDEQVINVLNWYPQPAKDFHNSRYVIETAPMDLDEIRDMFGTKDGDVSPDELEIEEWNNLFSRSMTPEGDLFSDETNRQDRALVKILRHVPSARFKNGLFVIATRNKLLYSSKDGLDSCDGTLPYTHIRYRELPGVFWGAGPICDILPQQKRINAVDSHIVLNRKQMISNQWLIPSGSGISKVTGEPGLIIRWNPAATGGVRPERIQGVPLPPQVMEERNLAQANMGSISGVRDIVSGQLPTGSSGLETGAAVEALYEQAHKRFRTAIRRWRAGLSHHFRRNLLLCSKYWSETRTIRVLGENQELETYYYSKSDLYGSEDVVVHTSIGMDYSKTAYQQKIFRATEQGLLGDVRTPEVRGRILEALEIDGFESEYVLDAKKARRVLRDLRKGEEPPPVLPGVDNHQIQYTILKDFALTSDFEQEEPEVQQAILQRIQQHQQFLQQAQQQTIQAAQAAKGTGAEVSEQVMNAMPGAAPSSTITQAIGG